MRKLKYVKRLNSDRAAIALASHIANRTPLIIDSFIGKYLKKKYSSLTNLRKVIQFEKLKLCKNFYDKRLSPCVSIPEEIDGGEYLDRLVSGRHNGKYVVINKSPATIKRDFQPLLGRLSIPKSIITSVAFFLADDCYKAPMHIDGDYRHSLFIQLQGQKKFYFVDPKFSSLLLPYKNYSTVQYHRLPAVLKIECLAACNATVGKLNAGDALFFPWGIWHYVENTGLSSGVSFRFGQNAIGRLLELLPQHHMTHVLYTLMIDHFKKKSAQKKYVYEVLSVFLRPYKSNLERKNKTIEVMQDMVHAIDKNCLIHSIQGQHFDSSYRKDQHELKADPAYWGVPKARDFIPWDLANRKQLTELSRHAKKTNQSCQNLEEIMESYDFPNKLDKLIQIEAEIINFRFNRTVAQGYQF